jgi:hypothetical protein
MTTDNERERAQLERTEEPDGSQPRLLVGLVLEGGHGFAVRGLHLATDDDMGQLGWIRKE